MNQSEVDQPYEGQKFKSFEALKKYLEEYGQRNYVKFWIRSSHTRNSLKSRISKTMNPDLKYVSVKFACIFGGEKIRCRGSGIRKSSTYRNLGCPCMINAVVGDDGNHVRLDTVILEHNHVLCKTLYDSLKKTKKKIVGNRLLKEVADSEVFLDEQGDELNSSLADVELKQYTKPEEEEQQQQPTKTCLKNIKDKFGRNVKILVINSENSSILLKNGDIKEEEETDCTGEEPVPLQTEICRLCLSSKDKLSPIFNPDLPLKSTVLSFKIMGCASIEISSDDGLPNNICKTCEADLDVAYNFRLRCENSDSILRKAYQKSDLISRFSSEFELEKVQSDSLNEESVQDSLINYLELGESEETDEAMEGDATTQDPLYVQFAISCPVCSCSFESYESMLDHLEMHTDNETILLTCNICNVICPSMKELHSHMCEHVNETTSEFSCAQCDLTFSTPEELRLHEDTHVRKKQTEMNFLCTVCGKILKTKDRFQSHKNTHEGLRPHVCLKCGRGFADRKNMHQHYDVVHLRKAKHECPVCQKKFYTRTKMKSHITMHYGVKPFTCDVCHKTFRLKMNMIKHKKTHSNDRPHQCDKCNAAFIDKNMLKRHSYIHGGIRPYPCPVCGHRFSVKFHLKKHLEKSKCSGGVVTDTEGYRWVGMAQPESQLTGSECVVVYNTTDETALQTEGEPISMDILQEYNEETNS